MSLTTIDKNNFFKKGVIGNVRKAQEDSCDFAPMTENGDIFVVCDGMGGHVGGAKASTLAVESILAYMKKEKYANPVEALNGALQFANMQILGYADDNPEFRGMGTTACIVLMQGDDVWVAHAGDSRIYLYLGKERELHRITKDHSYVQGLVDAGEITDEMAEHHPMKNRITKALGIRPELTPTITPLNQPIHPKDGDIFLICTDGLSGMISDRTISSVLAESTPLEQRGEKLIALAMEGEIVHPGGQDNCTLELIRVEGSPWKSSQFVSYNPHPTPPNSDTHPPKPSWLKSPITYVVMAVLVAAIVIGCILISNHNKAKKKAQLEQAYSVAVTSYNAAQALYEADSAKAVKDSLNVITWRDKVSKAEKDKPQKPKQAEMNNYAKRLKKAKENYDSAKNAYNKSKAKCVKSKADRDAKRSAMEAAKEQLEQLEGEAADQGKEEKAKVIGRATDQAGAIKSSTSTQPTATNNAHTQQGSRANNSSARPSQTGGTNNGQEQVNGLRKKAEKMIAQEGDVSNSQSKPTPEGQDKKEGNK